MVKKLKTFFLISGVLTFSILLLLTFFSREKTPARAQIISGFGLTCNEPIPVGKALEEALALIADTYKEYQNVRDYLNGAIDQLASATAKLYANPETICDYSACQPLVIDTAPDWEVKISYIFGSKKLVSFHIPFCEPQQCLGDPCPGLEPYLEDLLAFQDGVNASHKVLQKTYNKKSVLLTNDIRIKEGPEAETAGTLIRRPTAAIRWLDLAREWLHAPATLAKKTRTCSLSVPERKAVEAGELSDVFPIRCVDAIREGIYWPRPWSENCQAECSEKNIDKPGGFSACKGCLQKEDNNEPTASNLARLNYKIYKTCALPCIGDELTENCLNCLTCRNPQFNFAGILQPCRDRMSEDEGVAWLCGDSYFNWVCCSETSRELINPEPGED